MQKIIELKDVSGYKNLFNSKTIIAACGCFDIVHIGHIEYLTGAKELGDVLFVGINSDVSVMQNKGAFPVFTISDRMRLIAALECVDYVFSFSQKTFDYPLRELVPNFFARGVDADQKGFPEEETAKLLNIKVINIGVTKRASSRTLRKYFD